jgi:precorrin-2 dehydrogenase/sirohydrochlorin ferrochelatase
MFDGTSLYLKLDGKNVFVLGSGEVGTRRALRFYNSKANVKIIGENFCDEILNSDMEIINGFNLDEIKNSVKWADIVVIASTDSNLNDYTSVLAKDKLLNRADFPDKGNLIVPTKVNIDDLEISIFTGGKSPLMAREIRKKIESIISTKEVLQIKLQDYCRDILKKKLKSQRKRKEYLEIIFSDENIEKFLDNGEFEVAKEYVDNNILNSILEDK